MKSISSTRSTGEKGYTLIEISVVIVLIGVMLLMAIPRVQDTLTSDRMRSAVRNLSGNGAGPEGKRRSRTGRSFPCIWTWTSAVSGTPATT